jgi:hypothetical protein
MAKQEKTVKRIVVHPKLTMRVDGHMQRVPVGTELTLTETQAKRLGRKVADPADKKALESSEDGGMVEGTESEAVAALTAELEAAKAELDKTKEALTATGAELTKATKEVAALKAKAK